MRHCIWKYGARVSFSNSAGVRVGYAAPASVAALLIVVPPSWLCGILSILCDAPAVVEVQVLRSTRIDLTSHVSLGV